MIDKKQYEVEPSTRFSESLIWQLNRNYYNDTGVEAWRTGTVPHYMTSNSMVGKTYAELIFAFLKDLAKKGNTQKTVYILELGAGHGRLAFHILKHLECLKEELNLILPPCCYVLSDIVESNLNFFLTHPQFQYYFEKGLADVSYFDGVESKELHLKYSGKNISPQGLQQPILVVANYLLDSIPSDLFHYKNKEISVCSIALKSSKNPADIDDTTLIQNLSMDYSSSLLQSPFYEKTAWNELLEEYRELVFNTYLFFPHTGLQCIQNIQQLSTKGLLLISMDKGFHEIHNLENTKQPSLIKHGSISFSVNYHAYGLFCEKQGGLALFPAFSNSKLELGCLFFLPESEQYLETQAAYRRVVNDYGPDDYFRLKIFSHKFLKYMGILDLIGILRLGAYDSTIFELILPHIKNLSHKITYNERTRIAQTMHRTWNMYFHIQEREDMAFEMGGLFYQLGYYEEALQYFQFSVELFGHTVGSFYNRALCYYQLRQDASFGETVKAAKMHFPSEDFTHLDKLDLNAK